MSSFYHGEVLELSIFGQSHSPAIGMSLSGLPAGFAIDMDELSAFLRRRAPGQNAWSTPRKEADAPEFLSGLGHSSINTTRIYIMSTGTEHRHQMEKLGLLA